MEAVEAYINQKIEKEKSEPAAELADPINLVSIF